MPFPEVERVLYKKNPLDQVICQLRFPPILKIDAVVPADFQDAVRRHFPNFSETAWNLEFPRSMRGLVPPEVVGQSLRASMGKNYEFSSEDSCWKINLTRRFVALTTKKYERWEAYKEKLQIPLQALIDVYSPGHFGRIGLRYIDVIRRSVLGLDNVPWSELLQPHISGIIGSQEMSDKIKNLENQCEIGLSDGESEVRISSKLVENSNPAETCYMIDSDFYSAHKIEIASTLAKLDYFNERARRLLRWCITQPLHQAMEPQSL